MLVVLSGLAFACQLWALTSTSDITRKENSLQQVVAMLLPVVMQLERQLCMTP